MIKWGLSQEYRGLTFRINQCHSLLNKLKKKRKLYDHLNRHRKSVSQNLISIPDKNSQ